MQVMNCLEKEDFCECFGESSGDWLWGKFTGPYKHDIAGFICYLDYGNAQKLYTFIMKKIEKMAPGMISAMTEAVIGKILIDGKEVGDVTMVGDIHGSTKRKNNDLCVNCESISAKLTTDDGERVCSQCNEELGG